MCIGWWVGLGVSLLGINLGNISQPILNNVANAFCSSAWCWIIHVILIKIGAEEL
jgi:hypothetical protein